MTDNVTAVATKIDWSSLSGVILDGGYELKEVVDGRDDAAKVRVRILGSGGKTGIAYFIHLKPGDAEDQVDIWNTLREAPHAHLNRPAAVGKREVSGVEAVYMVLPDADEKLAAVVPERPLEWEEAAEVLQACEKGLAHLHAHGLLHGSVSPQTVEAVGYSVQLNTESVHRVGKTPRVQWGKPQYLAPESKNLNLTTAADVWCLGATLFEVLSQEPYGTAGAELEEGLPLAAVIHRCLDKNPLTRCTLRDASAGAQSAAMPPPPAAQPVVEALPLPIAAQPVKAPPQQPAPAAKAPVNGNAAPVQERKAPPPPQSQPTTGIRTPAASRLPQPLTPKEPPKQVSKDDMALVPIGKRHKKVKRQPVGAKIRTLDGDDQDIAVGESQSTALGPPVSARVTALGQKSNLVRNIAAGAGLAAILAAAIWFIVLPKLKSIDQPIPNSVPIQLPSDTAKADSNTPPPFGSPIRDDGKMPVVANPSADHPVTDSTTPSLPPEPRKYYRVVVAMYDSKQEANDAREALSAKHPELILQTPRMRSGADYKFVVAVGGALSISDAEPLLQRTIAKGIKTAHLERIEK